MIVAMFGWANVLVEALASRYIGIEALGGRERAAGRRLFVLVRGRLELPLCVKAPFAPAPWAKGLFRRGCGTTLDRTTLPF
jgi:hypothetical protein